MKLKLDNALKPFKRLPQIEVDCGGDFIVTIRQTAIHNQHYRAKATQWLERYNRRSGKGSKKKRVSVAAVGAESITGTGDRDADIDYFIDVLLVDWKGLKDDDGNEVACNPDNARQLFSSEEGWTLLQLLVQQSTNDTNFIAATESEEAEAIAKE